MGGKLLPRRLRCQLPRNSAVALPDEQLGERRQRSSIPLGSTGQRAGAVAALAASFTEASVLPRDLVARVLQPLHFSQQTLDIVCRAGERGMRNLQGQPPVANVPKFVLSHGIDLCWIEGAMLVAERKMVNAAKMWQVAAFHSVFHIAKTLRDNSLQVQSLTARVALQRFALHRKLCRMLPGAGLEVAIDEE